MFKNYIFYAAGSLEHGYGHLYRVLAIYRKYLTKKNSFFLYRNKLQKNFYKTYELNTIKLSKFSLKKNYIFIADTKETNIAYLNSIIENSTKSICIDTFNSWVNKFDKLVIPNFYFRKKNSPNINSNISISYGAKYCIIRKEFPKYQNKHAYLITFGGSDPNFITRKILNLIYKTVNSNEIMVLLGKGSLNKDKILKKRFPGIKILSDIPSTFEAIKNSKVIFTALGTTVQEIEAAQKKAVICFNYYNDLKDFKNIVASSKNKQLWLNGGHYSKINKSNIKKFIKNIDYKVDKTKNTTWGRGWKEILEL